MKSGITAVFGALCLAVVVCLLLPMAASATMLLGVHDWDDGTNVVEEGWSSMYIFRTGAVEQIYGIDNFMLMIPEPTQCMMLGFAGLVSLWSRRRKKKPPG